MVRKNDLLYAAERAAYWERVVLAEQERGSISSGGRGQVALPPPPPPRQSKRPELNPYQRHAEELARRGRIGRWILRFLIAAGLLGAGWSYFSGRSNSNNRVAGVGTEPEPVTGREVHGRMVRVVGGQQRTPQYYEYDATWTVPDPDEEYETPSSTTPMQTYHNINSNVREVAADATVTTYTLRDTADATGDFLGSVAGILDSVGDIEDAKQRTSRDRALLKAQKDTARLKVERERQSQRDQEQRMRERDAREKQSLAERQQRQRERMQEQARRDQELKRKQQEAARKEAARNAEKARKNAEKARRDAQKKIDAARKRLNQRTNQK